MPFKKSNVGNGLMSKRKITYRFYNILCNHITRITRKTSIFPVEVYTKFSTICKRVLQAKIIKQTCKKKERKAPIDGNPKVSKKNIF